MTTKIPDSHRNRTLRRTASLFAIILTLVSLTFLMFSKARAQAEDVDGWEILSPQPGQPILGSLPIEAILKADGVQGVDISFAYTDDPTSTWFLIGEISGAPRYQKLVDWETSLLADGNYTLRLTAVLEDGSHLSAAVPGLRVRNYTPIETATPTASATPAPASTSVPIPTATPTQTPLPQTATPLPANPAVLTEDDLGLHLALGVIGAGAFFAVLGLYISARRFFRG